jgi:ribonuclease HI
MSKTIKIYTDGSSQGNPGPGGYGAILEFGKHRKELTEGFRLTTNNRMELLAVIKAIMALKDNTYPVTVYSDSKYVVDAVEKGWVWNWRKKDYKGKKNSDLWEQFIGLYNKYRIKFVWVKGHAGHPENERCDELAVESAQGANLKIDKGYEQDSNSTLFPPQ